LWTIKKAIQPTYDSNQQSLAQQD